MPPLDRPTHELRAKVAPPLGPAPVSDEYWPSSLKFAFSPPPRSSEPFMPQRLVRYRPSVMDVTVPSDAGVVDVSMTLL